MPIHDPAVRPPAVAGLFYPNDPGTLAAAVDAYVGAGSGWQAPVKALIAPHAGYVYSGPIAGSAYAALAGRENAVERIVLIGPAHRCAFDGIATVSASALATPLGTVPVDEGARRIALACPCVDVLDEAFDGEHGLEVHLPFILRTLGRVPVLPLLVSDASRASVDGVLDALWGGPETLIIVSSDLSHYHAYTAAQRLDTATTGMIETLAGDGLTGRNACGYRAVDGLTQVARRRDQRITTFDLRNSGDTAGPHDRVVGYGAYVVEEALTARTDERHRDQLRAVARKAVLNAGAGGKAERPDAASFPPPLRALRNTFVTLEVDGRLRGCVGSVAPTRPLVADVADNAHRAATSDPRFPPMTPEEADRAQISIAILSHQQPIACETEADLIARLRPGTDGVMVTEGTHRGLFLPKVWSTFDQPGQFLAHLKAKAGIAADHWSGDIQVVRFTAEAF